MFAQLGNTIFDGMKSFVSFSDDEEAIIVEHALINRKPRLQATAPGLRNLNISIFLHQEYCIVLDEVNKLRTSKNNFEILPLLWGNGHLEGSFVIINMSSTNVQMDEFGNTVAAAITLALKESVVDDQLNQLQQTAQKNATATGNKKPPTKSNRVNKTPCNQQISNTVSVITNNAGRVDFYSRQYISDTTVNNKMISHLSIISNNAASLVSAAADPSSCAYQLPNLSSSATNVISWSDSLKKQVLFNNNNGFVLGFTPNIAAVQTDNDSLQAAVKALQASVSKLTKSAIVKK